MTQPSAVQRPPTVVISQAIRTVREAAQDSDLSELITTTQGIVDGILNDSTHPYFTRVISLYFSFMEECLNHSRMDRATYQKACLAKIAALSKAQLPNQEEREALTFLLAQKRASIQVLNPQT